MNEQQHPDQHAHDACGAGIFRAVFRLLAIADLYGPERAIEWAQSLVDDADLLSAYANAPQRPVAEEITVRRLGASVRPMTLPRQAPDSASWN